MLRSKQLLLSIFIFISSYLCGDTIAFITDSIGFVSYPGFPDLVEKHYKDQGINHIFIKDCQGGVPTSVGVSKLNRMLQKQKIDYLVLTLGINDALIPPHQLIEETYKNLIDIIVLANKFSIQVLLGTIELTAYHYRLLDYEYELQFEEMYEKLKEEFGVHVFPFITQEIISKYFYDGIHPTYAGQLIISKRIEELLDSLLIATKNREVFNE